MKHYVFIRIRLTVSSFLLLELPPIHITTPLLLQRMRSYVFIAYSRPLSTFVRATTVSLSLPRAVADVIELFMRGGKKCGRTKEGEEEEAVEGGGGGPLWTPALGGRRRRRRNGI